MDKFKKARATYPITGGLRQDISQDVLTPDNYAVVENLVYRKEGEAVSRNGYKKLFQTSNYPTPRLFNYENQLLLSSNKRFNRIDFRDKNEVFKNNFINFKSEFFFISQKERDIFFPSILKVGDIIFYGYVFKDRVYVKQFDTVQKIINVEETPFDQEDNISGLSLMNIENEVFVVYSSGNNIYVNKYGNTKSARVELRLTNLRDFVVLNGDEIHYEDTSGVKNFVKFNGTTFEAPATSTETIVEDTTFTAGGTRVFGFRKWASFQYQGGAYQIGWTPYVGMVIVDTNGDIVTKINSTQTPVRDRPDITTKTPFIEISGSIYVPLFFSGQAEFEDGTSIRPVGVGLLRLEQGESDVQATTLNNHMLFAGSSLNLYDGENFVEYGFSRRPNLNFTSVTVPERTSPLTVPEVQEGDYETNVTVDRFDSLYNTQSFTFRAASDSSGVGYKEGTLGAITSGTPDLSLDTFKIESIIYNTSIKAIEVTFNKIGVVGAFQIGGTDYKIDDRVIVNNKTVGRHYTSIPVLVSGTTYTFQMLPTLLHLSSGSLGTIDVSKSIIGNRFLFEQVSSYTETQVGTTSNEEADVLSLAANIGSTATSNRWAEEASTAVAEWRDSYLGRISYRRSDESAIRFGNIGQDQIDIDIGHAQGEVINSDLIKNNSNNISGGFGEFVANDMLYEGYDTSGRDGDYNFTWRAHDVNGNRVPNKDFTFDMSNVFTSIPNNTISFSGCGYYKGSVYMFVYTRGASFFDPNPQGRIVKINLETKTLEANQLVLSNFDYTPDGFSVDKDYVYLIFGRGDRSSDPSYSGGVQVYSRSTLVRDSGLSFGKSSLFSFEGSDSASVETLSGYAYNGIVYIQRRFYRQSGDPEEIVGISISTRQIVTTLVSRSSEDKEIRFGYNNRIYLDNRTLISVTNTTPVLTIRDTTGKLNSLLIETDRVNINDDLQIPFTLAAADLNSDNKIAIVSLSSEFNNQLKALDPQSNWNAFIETFFQGTDKVTTKEIRFDRGDTLRILDPDFDFSTLVGETITFTNAGGSYSFVLTSGDLTSNNDVSKTLPNNTLSDTIISNQTGTAKVSYEREVTTYVTEVSTTPSMSYFTLDVAKEGLVKDDLQGYVTLIRRSDTTIKQAMNLSEFKSISSARHLFSTVTNSLITYPFLENEELLKFVYPGGTTSTTTIAIAFQNRTYGYRYLYKWIDSKGFEHRSIPSEPVVVKSENDISETNVVTLSLATLNLTRKQGVVIEVYRTKKDSTLYRHVADVDNVVSTERVPFVDGVLDDDLGSPIEPFLDQFQPDGGRLIERFADRFCVAGFSVEKNKLIYSKPVNLSGNFGVSFSEDDFIVLDSPIVAIRRMDALLIIFTEESIYAWALGAEPTYISGSKNNSVTDANSVVETSAGIVYKSQKGIYLLTRGRELKYIGIPVQEYNDRRVLRAVEMKSQNEIRFILSDNNILVYNFHYGKWSVLKGDFEDGLIHNDTLYLMDSQGVLFEEEDKPPSASILSHFETGWISFADHSEFKKLKAFRLTAEFEGLELLECSIFYDFNKNAFESLDLDDEKFRDTSIKDIEIPSREFGVTSLSDIRLLRFLPRRQKCESFKLRFSFRAKQAKVTALGFEYYTTNTLSRIPPIAQV